jgi:hypothetical protein
MAKGKGKKETKADIATKTKKSASIVDEPKEEVESKDDLNIQASVNPLVDPSSTQINEQPIKTTPPPEEIIEIEYKEPVLNSVIVQDYEGDKEKGLFKGFGKLNYIGGQYYEGEFEGNMMSGKGKYIWKDDNVMYEGDFLNNEITGNGIYQWNYSSNSVAVYEGKVYKGKRHGLGTFKSGNSNIVYIGEWNMGVRYGKVIQFHFIQCLSKEN